MKRLLIYGLAIVVAVLIGYTLHREYLRRYLTHRERVKAQEAVDALDVLREHVNDGGRAYQLRLLDAEKSVAETKSASAETIRDQLVAVEVDQYLEVLKECRLDNEMVRNNQKLLSSGVSVVPQAQVAEMMKGCSNQLDHLRSAVLKEIR